MEPIRADLVTAARGLLRLAVRVRACLVAVHERDRHLVRVRDLQPVSGWIDAVSGENALGGVEARAVQVAERVLCIAAGLGPVDPTYAALTMQVVSGDALAFSSHVRHFAERHGIDLPIRTRDMPGYNDVLRDVALAMEWIAKQRIQTAAVRRPRSQ